MSEQDYQKFLEKTSADPTQAGFDFQFFAFLYLILKMEADSTVEYETGDDLLYIPEKGKKQLIQAKFAVLDKDKKLPNLTTRDVELWHTIYNWITGSEMLRDDSYFTTRQFIIWTDKDFENNSFFKAIQSFQNKDTLINDFDNTLDDLITNTKDGDTQKPNEVKAGIEKLKSLSIKDRTTFCSNFTMRRFPETSIIDEIKKVLEQEKFIPKDKVDEVYNSLHSEIKTDRFFEIFKRDKTIIKAAEFSKKYKRCFNKPFNRKLNIDRSLTQIMPENICSETFIRQLLDIERIFPDDKLKIQDMFRQKMCTRMNIDKWRTDGDLLDSEEKDLDTVAYRKWEVEFDISHRDIHKNVKQGMPVTETEFNTAAANCYDEICRKDITFNEGYFDQETAIGYFYELSDEPRIGWHYHWEEKYKNNDI